LGIQSKSVTALAELKQNFQMHARLFVKKENMSLKTFRKILTTGIFFSGPKRNI